MKRIQISRMVVGSELIIAIFTIGYGILMLITEFFQADHLPILKFFDGRFDAFFLFIIGFLLVAGIAANMKKIVMPILVLLCGVFLGYSGAYLAHAANGFPSVGLIAFICMFLLDFLTLLEVNPDE